MRIANITDTINDEGEQPAARRWSRQEHGAATTQWHAANVQHKNEANPAEPHQSEGARKPRVGEQRLTHQVLGEEVGLVDDGHAHAPLGVLAELQQLRQQAVGQTRRAQGLRATESGTLI